MSSVNQFLVAGRARSINLLAYTKTNPQKMPSVATLFVQKGDSSVSFGQAALKMLDEKKKWLEDEKEKIRKALKEARVQSDRLKETEKTQKKAAAMKRLGELKDRLRLLVRMMQSAFMCGDKKAAARIAKEAAEIAKEVKVLLKELGGQDYSSSVSVGFSREGEDGTESAENVAGIENIENMEGGDEASGEGVNAETAAAASEAEQTEQEAEAFGEANNSERTDDKKTEDARENREARERGQTEGLKNQIKDVLAKVSAPAIKIEINQADSLEAAAKDLLIMEIKAYLHAIANMAKAVLKNKPPLPDGSTENSAVSNYQKDAGEADVELEEAVEELEGAIKEM